MKSNLDKLISTPCTTSQIPCILLIPPKSLLLGTEIVCSVGNGGR